jgi:tRNA(Ile)-lysidine synthetase-like protein
LPAGLDADTGLVEGHRVLVALSGGPDSTALLLWLGEQGVEVAAAHYDHALRAGSERDARHVARLCADLGVPLLTERRRDPLSPGSIQAGARAARYEFLARALDESGCRRCALGHTADDVVEGTLLHLLRGSGLAGLRGMPAVRGPYVRPFWWVWRADVERYLAAHGVSPLRDPSNDDRRFARARVRHQLLPALEHDRPGLTRRLWAVATRAGQLQVEVEEAASRLPPSRAALRGAPRVVRLEAYRRLYGRLPALSRRHLEAIDSLALRGRTGQAVDLPGSLRLWVERDGLRVGPREQPRAPAPRLVVRPCPGCEDERAAHLRPGPALSLGFRSPGLRMRPAVGGRPRTRKLQDILTDARVPRHLRDTLPLVFADGRLAWVPGVAVDAELAAAAGEPSLHVSVEAAPAPGGGWPETGRGKEKLVLLSGAASPRRSTA